MVDRVLRDSLVLTPRQSKRAVVNYEHLTSPARSKGSYSSFLMFFRTSHFNVLYFLKENAKKYSCLSDRSRKATWLRFDVAAFLTYLCLSFVLLT